MRPVSRILVCAAGAIVASLLTACGSGSSAPVPANIRLVNDTSAALNMTVGSYAISGVASDTASGYIQTTPGTYTVSVAGATAGLTAGPSQTVGLGTAQYYTTIAYQRNSTVYAATITDNLAVPGTGATLDVVNVSPDAGPLDIYFLVGTTSLAGQSPSFTSVQGLTPAATFATGTYNVVVTAAGSTSDIRLQISGLALTTGQVGSLALTSTTGGALVNGAFINQGGTATFYPATQARVRVLSALPQAGQSAVNVTVGTQALATDYAPNPNGYALVTGGAAVTAVSIAGTAITTGLPTGTFAAGQDYTLLVYGTPGSPSFAILADDNQTKTNFASVRLVNGAVTNAAGVAMYVDNAPTATSVAYGTGSGYFGVSPASQANLNVISGSYSATATADLVTGSVYTVFVYDPTTGLAPLIIKDR